jgi:endonuclease/exonuclease/phosphatase family metal-dependent hydrolase
MQIKILSWNIWYDGYFDEISKFLKESNADIIGLQEVVPENKSRDVITFLKKLGYKHAFSAAMEIRNDGRIMGNAIFSKYEILSSNTYLLSETESRNAVHSEIKIAGKTLNVFCTHLLHTHQEPSEIQELQIENLIKALPRENTILMGDFNATPKSTSIKKISEVLLNTDNSSAITWDASYAKSICPVCTPKAVKDRLDYIFLSKDLKANSFKIEDSKGSDHLAVSVNIEI